MKEYNSSEIDVLREIGNIGIGNAATSLSKLMNDKTISINIPITNFIDISKFADEIGGAENKVIGLYLEIQGDLKGECIFVFDEKSALELSNMILDTPDNKTMSDIEISAFKEMSNIFSGSYLNSMASMLDLKIIPSVPYIGIDMAQALIDSLLINMAQVSNKILCVKSSINLDNSDIDGKFIIVFEDESYNKILSRIKEIYDLK